MNQILLTLFEDRYRACIFMLFDLQSFKKIARSHLWQSRLRFETDLTMAPLRRP